MQLSQAFVSLGEDRFGELVRGISIGKLRTYQLYESFKTRAHLAKVNTESLRKGVPRFWQRLGEGEEELAKELAQAVLLSHLDMIRAVLEFLGIPHQDGFFGKELDASKYLTEGWQQRVYEKFRGQFPEAVLRFYINHLAWELAKDEAVFVPAN
jgi:inorganic triphosphatase YgiF